MDSSNLSLRQLRRVHESVSEHLRYLHRLQSRMIQQGFPRSDLLWQNVERAVKAMELLCVAADPEERQRQERQQALGR